MPTPIRAQDSLRLTQPRPLPQASEAATPRPRAFEDDTFFRTAPSPQQVESMHRAVAALGSLPPAPKSGVLEQRAWLARIAPVLSAAERSATGLANAAFFHEVGSLDAADAARAKVRAFAARVGRIEELAGLREPVPPMDPNRPRGQALKFTDRLLQDPVGAPLGALVAPLAFLYDGADALSRPSERAAYPAAVKDYQARLAAYRKARQEHPLP